MRVAGAGRVAGLAVALIVSALAERATADVVLNPVAWLSAPTKADLEAASQKYAVGQAGGHALLRCQLQPTGALSNCEASPIPGGAFDRAALSLVPKFKAFVPPDAASRKDRVFVELRFSFGDPGRSTETLQLTDPAYLQTSGEASATSVAPQAAAGGVKRTLAVVDCDATATGALASCAVVKEVPTDMGVGAAAMDVLSKRRLNLWQVGSPVAGARVRIPFYTDAPDADGDPSFTREAEFHVPRGWSGTAGPYYPERAERLRISGAAAIECGLQPSGALTDCIAIAETPQGQNFMDAALLMAERGVMTAKRPPRDSTDQARAVRVTVPFRP